MNTTIIKGLLPDDFVTGIVSSSNQLYFEPPKIVNSFPYSLEREVTAALSRLHYAINANTEYHLLQMKRSWAIRNRSLLNAPTYYYNIKPITKDEEVLTYQFMFLDPKGKIPKSLIPISTEDLESDQCRKPCNKSPGQKCYQHPNSAMI